MTRLVSRRFWLLLLVGLLAASGCGNGALSEDAAEDLQQRAAAIRAAAESRDVDAAQEALTGLRAALDAHVEADAVSPGRARDISAAADAVAARLPLLVEEEVEPPPDAEQTPDAEPPPEDEPAPTEPPPPATPEPDPDEDKEEDKDKDEDEEGEGGEGGEGGEEDGRGPDSEGPPGQSRGADGA